MSVKIVLPGATTVVLPSGDTKIVLNSTPTKIVTGLQGAQGIPGEGTTYTHTQSSASDTWTVNHNLNAYPDISVVVGGQIVEAQIAHTTLNQSIIYFASLVSGTARCS